MGVGNPVKHLKAAQEVMVGTTSPSGDHHETKLWVVVVDGKPYLRSMNGPGARWYRELTSAGSGELVALDDGWRLPISVERVGDPDVVHDVSKAFKKKYGWTHPQYIKRFLDEESLEATLRLDVGTPVAGDGRPAG
jgi:hypothetical protein